jgi:hypothetical protein
MMAAIGLLFFQFCLLTCQQDCGDAFSEPYHHKFQSNRPIPGSSKGFVKWNCSQSEIYLKWPKPFERSSSGLRSCRRTYHTILKLADHSLFKMVRYGLLRPLRLERRSAVTSNKFLIGSNFIWQSLFIFFTIAMSFIWQLPCTMQ